MIERILKQQQAICAVLAEDRKNWDKMPSVEVTCLEAIASVLEPLSTFTDALSGEYCVTISAVAPLLNHITTVILLETASDNAIAKEMKKIIREGRYLVTDMLLMEKSSYLVSTTVPFGYDSSRNNLRGIINSFRCTAIYYCRCYSRSIIEVLITSQF